MRRLFLKLSMLLFVLGMSVNAAWADEDPMLDYYWARLIAQPSTGTGGAGKVCVTSDGKPFNYESPAWKSDTSRAEGYSQVYIEISAGNLFTVDLTAHALPDEGSYFTGWSFSNGGTDLGIGTYEWEKYELRQFFLPSKKYGYSNLREYEIYATFMPLLIESYTISGSNTTESRTCTQTVTFRVAGTLANVKDFNVPEIIKQTGSGTWTVVPNTTEAWEYENGAGTKNYTYSTTYDDYAEIRVPVTFTADDDNAGEFSATLQLRSKAGKTMNVVLSARTTVAGAQAIRYNKSKEQQEAGDLTDLLSHAATDDIIKLNGDYSDAVSINKSITFDLNGYTLSNTLTVSGGNVTLAYSPFGGTISSNVSVTSGKLTLTGGTITANVSVSAGATLEQNGASITGTVTNAGTMTTTDGAITGQLASSGTLTLNGGTFTNNSGVAVNITGGTAQIKKGTINGSTYGVQSAGSTAIEKLAAITGTTRALKRTAGTLTVNNGKFSDPADLAEGDIVFNAAYFQNTTGTTAFGKQVWRNTAGAEYRDGYLFFVGDQEAAQASNVSVCRIGKTAYASLEEAFAYANNNPSKEVVIFMENDYTLKAGYYTIPENATLVIPMSNEQDATYSIVPRESGDTPSPYAFRTLTLENGVNMTVLGTIELTCTQYCKSGNEAQSIPGGPYGHMILKPGSHITLSSGSELRAWGYVTGDGTRDASGNYLSGEIDARRGSVVREQFQMGDWKGGDISFTMIMDQAPQNMTRLFPVYEYFIQNIESPVKYHPGASLICAVSVDVSFINAYANEIRLIGVETSDPAKWSMFMMDETADAENTWVRKYYDAKKDQQVYEVNNSAQLGSLKIDLGEVPGEFFGLPGKYHIELDSRKFVLPLTSNFKIHLLSGLMEFTQSTSCLPGMEVEVDKEAEIQIIPSSDPGTVSGALYFYDADQWSFMNMKLGSYVGLAGNPKYGAIVTYSATLNAQPSVRNIDSPEALGDAKLIVHGTFRSARGCSVYTTWTKGTGSTLEDNPFVINPAGTGGASIISTNEDAGTFIFDDASPAFDGVHWDDPANFGQIEHLTGFGNSVLVNFDNNNYGDATYPIQIYTVIEKEMKHSDKYTRMYGFELCTPAMLQNGDGSLVVTEGSQAGTSFCYMNGRWTTMTVEEENDCFMKDNYDTYYAKPQEYVAVNATKIMDGETFVEIKGNDDHTFSDAAGAGRLFILMDDCQWWEVEKKDNLYHCIHPNNDTYYYWDDTESKWMEQRFTITWLNWDGDTIKSYIQDGPDTVEVAYSVTYGTQATFLGSNPTRDADIDYTYNFTGWTPALGPVKSNVTYTATYVQQPRKYTIIFTEEGGKEIERQFLLHNDVPVCENVPTRTGFTLQWEPALAAVTGDATYRATWLEEPPTEYEITFIDYDGTSVLQQGNVAVGIVPEYTGATPTGKPETSEYTYVFDHWSPALEEVSATSAKVYTAVYREEAREYTISYFKENGTTPNETKASESLPYGATPTPPAVTKESPVEGHSYTLVWKTLDEKGGIQTVMGNASYKPTYLDVLNRYAVTLKANPSGACTFTGAGTFDYGTNVTNVAVSYNSAEYEFQGWADLTGDAKTATTHTAFTLTKDTTIVANFRYKGDDKVTITWKNWNGDDLGTSEPKINAATTYTGATPTRTATDEKTYTFYGWTTRDNEGHDIDTIKNGLTPKATANATYYAYFTEEARKYTISWKNEAGTADIEVDYNQPYGTAIAYNSATPTKQATAAATYAFDGWSTSQGGDVVALPATVSGDATYYAHFAATPKTYTVTWKRDDGSLIDNTEVEFGVTPSHADPTKPATPQYTYTFTGWDRPFEPVTGLTSYTASFSQTTNTYTITWLDGDGNELDTEELEYGATPSYVGATPTKTATAHTTYTFNGKWSPSIVAVTGDATYTAQFNEALEIEVGESENLNHEVVESTNLMITSNGVTSGQLKDAENLTVTGEAIFRLEKTFAAETWYAVAVPWRVDPATGIHNAEGAHLSTGNVYVIEFDANAYASADRENGRTDYWKFLDDTHNDMEPGKLYMVYLAAGTNALEFHKKAGASLWTTSTSVAPASGSVAAQANWNAIANPALYYANMSTGATDVQMYNGNDTYIAATSTNMVVGQPIFAQVSTPSTVVATPAGGGAGMPAYRRASQETTADNRFVVELNHNGNLADRLIVQTAEEKANEYVIDMDLAKMSVSTKVAQMWMERYNTKLCKNTVEMNGDHADYPLSISAPVAGEYILTAMQQRGDKALYLTYHGQAIWNLSESDFVLSLEQGATNEYGLRVSAHAPHTTTGIDEAVVDAQGDTRKVLINDKVFIIRGDKVYSIDGQLVK